MVTNHLLNRLFPSVTFSDTEQEILQIIILAIQQDSSLNIKTIAVESFVSASTVSRLVKKTHCNNYSELLYFLKESLQGGQHFTVEEFPFLSISSDYQTVISTLQSWVQNYQCYSYGEGFCRFINFHFTKKLLVMSQISVDIDAMELSRVHFSNQNPPLLFIFSKSGETKGCIERMKECQSLSGKVISFVSSKSSTIYKESDISFCIQGGHPHDLENSRPNYFYGNTINVIEFLCGKIFIEDKEKDTTKKS